MTICLRIRPSPNQFPLKPHHLPRQNFHRLLLFLHASVLTPSARLRPRETLIFHFLLLGVFGVCDGVEHVGDDGGVEAEDGFLFVVFLDIVIKSQLLM